MASLAVNTNFDPTSHSPSFTSTPDVVHESNSYTPKKIPVNVISPVVLGSTTRTPSMGVSTTGAVIPTFGPELRIRVPVSTPGVPTSVIDLAVAAVSSYEPKISKCPLISADVELSSNDGMGTARPTSPPGVHVVGEVIYVLFATMPTCEAGSSISPGPSPVWTATRPTMCTNLEETA